MTLGQRLRKVGDLVDLEALVGLVDPPLARLQQSVQVHRPCVVVDVIGALPVGEELDALDQASWVSHDGIEVVGCVVVDEPEGYLDRLGVQEIAAGRQRDARHPAAGGREGAEAAWEELYVFSSYHVGCVRGAHLEIKRTDEFIVDGVW